jgi:intracellular sulfur oxidation DsrE/DsrF family protein
MKRLYMIVFIVFLTAAGSAYGAEGIKVDIPLVLKDVKVVFNMDHHAFDGDIPVGVNYMRLLVERMKDQKATGRIVAIFHAKAAYMTLKDETYNKFRKVTTGNPYRKLITDLIAAGVDIEECMVSMGAHGWTNSDLIPGVKVNGGAVGRLIQLGQDGFVAIQP